MRTRNILAALAALAAIAATPVSAAEDDLGVYVGVALGHSDMRQACEGVAISCEDTDVGWKVIAGVAHYHGFNLELAYARLGEAEASGAGVQATKRVSLWEISALKDFRLSNRLGVYPKAGIYHYDVDVRASAPVANFAPTEHISSGGFAPTIGAGARFNLGRKIALRAEWQRYFDAGEPRETGRTDIDFASLALLYMF
jgi:OOP family OmpA-OmpF porin